MVGQQRKAEEEEEKKQSRLIVMLNLQVNDTITMPTPAIAMETSFIASIGWREAPPHPGAVCCVCIFSCVRFYNPAPAPVS